MSATAQSMRTFFTVWLGQFGSTIGSRMTHFALTLWAWDITQQATAIALVGFFTQIPRLLVTPLAGVLVDLCPRKGLMMVGDTAAGISTVVLLTLYLSGQLHIWHLYGVGAVNGAFSQIQQLAYTASMSLMVPKAHYTRALSLNFLSGYGSGIFAPALAGILYGIVGLLGILLVDLSTFAIAILVLLAVAIPQPDATPDPDADLPKERPDNGIHHYAQEIWRDITSGFSYIRDRPGMLGILVTASLFQFAHEISNGVFAPMILARSNNNAQTFGLVSATAGIGGVIGALTITAWGGPQRRIHGILLGMAGAGLSKLVLGLGRTPAVWVPAQFCSSLNFPLMGSSGNAIWLSQVSPERQGRVFSASILTKGAIAPLGRLLAGPLADRVLEPAMMPQGRLAPLLGSLFGTGTGAGMAVLYVGAAIAMTLIGLSGYLYAPLRNVES